MEKDVKKAVKQAREVNDTTVKITKLSDSLINIRKSLMFAKEKFNQPNKNVRMEKNVKQAVKKARWTSGK